MPHASVLELIAQQCAEHIERCTTPMAAAVGAAFEAIDTFRLQRTFMHAAKAGAAEHGEEREAESVPVHGLMVEWVLVGTAHGLGFKEVMAALAAYRAAWAQTLRYHQILWKEMGPLSILKKQPHTYAKWKVTPERMAQTLWADVTKEAVPRAVIASEELARRTLLPGVYHIKTTAHEAGQQAAGWGLAAWHNNDRKRNDYSSWVCVHSGDEWPCDWTVSAGRTPGTYRISTNGHEAGGQPKGWGLAAWHGIGDSKRNDYSAWAAVHSGDEWPCDWTIVPGKQPNTWRILTVAHAGGKQPAGWGLSAWHVHGAERNDWSSKVAVHSGDHWPMDWAFEVVPGNDAEAAMSAPVAVEGEESEANAKAPGEVGAAADQNGAQAGDEEAAEGKREEERKEEPQLEPEAGAGDSQHQPTQKSTPISSPTRRGEENPRASKRSKMEQFTLNCIEMLQQAGRCNEAWEAICKPPNGDNPLGPKTVS